MHYLTLVAWFFIVFMFSFSWGILTIKYKVFPWSTINSTMKEIEAFIKSDPNEPTISASQKLESDWGGIPYRFFQEVEKSYTPPPESNTFKFNEQGVYMLGGYNNGLPPGYFVVTGAFNFEAPGNMGTILISTQGKFMGGWVHNTKPHVNPAIDHKRRLFLTSATELFPWGCDLKNLDRKIPVHKYGSNFHHGVQIAPDGTYWTSNRDQNIVQLDPEQKETDGTYKIVRKFHVGEELLRKNSSISPVSARFSLTWNLKHDPQKIRPLIGLEKNPFHTNDFEPVVDKRFPTEMGYALMVSLREQNLIMIIDPVTKKILWFRQGLTERQHDPDHFQDGIYVYNNRAFSGHSRLVYIPFESRSEEHFGLKTVIDGKLHNWFDPSRGQHDIFVYNKSRYHLIVNDRMGRVFLFHQNGKKMFEVVNILSNQKDTRKRLQLRSALFITQEQLDNLQSGCE